MTQEETREISKAKNRVHSIVLTVQAEIIYRELQNKELPRGWLNRKISEFLIDKLGDRKKLLIYEMMKLKKQRDKHEKKCKDLANELNEIKMSEQNQAVKR